jgi:hypothetical protein
LSRRDKKQPKSHKASKTVQEYQSMVEKLHPSLRESFVLLPPPGTRLTVEQLEAVFGGDLRGLRELARLAYQPGKTDPEL